MGIMEMWRKARETGLRPDNIFAWASWRLGDIPDAVAGHAAMLVARARGVRVGPRARARGYFHVRRWPSASIEIGADASIKSAPMRATAAPLAWPTSFTAYGGARIVIGEGTEISGSAFTARSTSITLGRGCMVAPNCVLADSDFHVLWPPEARRFDPGYERDAPIEIGDNVWLGMGCMVLKGVRIGSGAMVGAGSLVCRDVPPGCLAAGNPARVIRTLGAGS